MGRRRYYNKGKRCSKGEKRIAEFLDRNGIVYEQEKTFDGCRNAKGHRLRYDFYLPQYRILIEYNGEHHYGAINAKQRSKIVHKITEEHDSIKLQFAQNAKYNFLIIPHWNFNEIEKMITEAVNYVAGQEQLHVPDDVETDIDYSAIIS